MKKIALLMGICVASLLRPAAPKSSSAPQLMTVLSMTQPALKEESYSRENSKQSAEISVYAQAEFIRNNGQTKITLTFPDSSYTVTRFINKTTIQNIASENANSPNAIVRIKQSDDDQNLIDTVIKDCAVKDAFYL